VVLEFTHLQDQDQGPVPVGAAPISVLSDPQRFCVGAPKKYWLFEVPHAPTRGILRDWQGISSPPGDSPLQIQFHEFPSHVGVVGDPFWQRTPDVVGIVVSCQYTSQLAVPHLASLHVGFVSGQALANVVPPKRYPITKRVRRHHFDIFFVFMCVV